jgi:hypothetical protein
MFVAADFSLVMGRKPVPGATQISPGEQHEEIRSHTGPILARQTAFPAEKIAYKYFLH